MLQGTAAIRRLRWAQAAGGKSGSVRVVYYFHSELMPLYLLAVFGKNEKANLSKEERKALAKAVRELVLTWKRRNEQGLH